MAKELKEAAKRIVLCREEREVVTIELGILIDEIHAIEVSLTDVDKRIEAKVRQHPIAVKLLEMPGEGVYSAGVDVGEVLPLARNVSEGKAATYAGLTPLSRRSGKKGRPSRLARGINKHATRANYLSAVAYYNKQLKRHEGHPRAHVKANIALARQRFKLKYKLMTTDTHYDKEILIASHLKRLRRDCTDQNFLGAA
jgi:transposase